MPNQEVYDANVRVRALPRDVDSILNALATVRGIPKWELIRVALCEFAAKHRGELTPSLRSQ